jgi:cell division protein ZapA (FtsZ GTPase activity inhibitor)
MALLELYVGKSKYTIDCEESEKAKIISLASRLNERVNNLSLKMRGADEKTVLMLCCVMIEEELEEFKIIKNTNQTPKEHGIIQESNQDSSIDMQKTMSKNLDDISIYIENLANKIKMY